MNENTVRLLSVKLKRMKNVGKGIVKMPEFNDNFFEEPSAEILGVYGQNGSGKTAIIDALSFIKSLIAGSHLPKDAMNYINGASETAEIEVSFRIISNKDYIIKYLCEIGRNEEKGGPEIVSEKLSYGIMTDLEYPKIFTVLMESKSRSSTSFSTQLGNMIGNDNESAIDVMVIKKIAYRELRSFIFASDMKKYIKAQAQISPDWNVINILSEYALKNMFIVNQSYSGAISMDYAIPFSMQHQSEDLSAGDIYISLSEPTVLEMKNYTVFKNITEEINKVIVTIIPGLKLQIREYGEQATRDGKNGMRFELLSSREGMVFPLRYESEGIKKIISILNMITIMYNDPSVFVAIDELDAGVFEYLLGELLRVIDETGEGQLLFTSHNLRPLEMLKDNSILFTTANPDNRYIRVKEDNRNLRERYIRALHIGEGDESMYTKTLKSEIRRALFNAGEGLK